LREKFIVFATPTWLDWHSPCGLQVSFQPPTTVSVGKQYPITGPPPSASTCRPPSTSTSSPPYISPPSSIAPPAPIALPPYTASPFPPEKASTSLSTSFRIKDGASPKRKKVVQKGMHIKSGGGMNSQESLLSDTKKPKAKADRSGRMLSAGGVRGGGASTGGGPRFTSMKYAGGWV